MSSDTRGKILDAALRSFVADGWEQTTIARIRELSGTSNGALFHHFASKEAIGDALYVEAIGSFQEGLWELLGARPASLHAAVHGTISHQLRWIEQHPDLARFLYRRGHLEWNSPERAELTSRNRDLGIAIREWMAPLIASGEVRALPIVTVSAIVGGPAHAIAQRWLAGQLDRPLTAFVDVLADAACAALRGMPGPGSHAAPIPGPGSHAGATPGPAGTRTSLPAAQGRLTLELLSESGDVVARGQATADLVGSPAAALDWLDD